MQAEKFAAAIVFVVLAFIMGCEQSKPTQTTAPSADQAAISKPAPPSCTDCVPVTAENFPRAETDLMFSDFSRDGAFGKFVHNRAPVPIDKQNVVRMNRDTVYSSAVFDLDAGPVTITLPDAGKRFMSMQIVNEDQYTPMVVYGKGSYVLEKKKIGTRYVVALVRILADPNNQQDLDDVHKLQDAIKVTQASIGTFEIPKWDQASQEKVRDALKTLGSTMKEYNNAFGNKQQVDPVMFLIGSAVGWGGNPDNDAKYASLPIPNNDGKQIYRLTVKDVPVDGFWSISVYNAKGYFEANPQNAYSINNITAQKNPDKSVTIQFGGCDGRIPNCLPITAGWNATVRMYRPHPEIVTGKWKFPEPQPLS